MQFYFAKHNFLDFDELQVQTYLVKLPFYDVTTIALNSQNIEPW